VKTAKTVICNLQQGATMGSNLQSRVDNNERIVPIDLPNGNSAFLCFSLTEKGQWQCTMDNEFMIDLQTLLRGEEIRDDFGKEYVKPWQGNIDLE
jgi:VCBS repeat-containing protein